jgi:uncharacterized protein involved in outer membrane biogenesis
VKKFFWAIGALLVIAGAAVLVGPGLIDWNQYKGDIQAQVRKATGHDIRINGDISITVLPAPALIVHDVSLANIDGAQAKNMLQLKSLEVRVALAPLLGGQVKVERIKLVNPVIELEVLPDGRRNWMFATGPSSGGKNTALVPPAPDSGGVQTTDPKSQPAAGGAVPPVALDNLSIENGTLVYRDSLGGTFEKIEALNGKFSAASLKGPFQSTGSLTARGLALDFTLNVGEIIHGRTVPFTLRLGTAPGTMKMLMSGTLAGLGDVPRIKGSIKGEAKSLAAFIQAARPVSLPGPLGQAFSFEANIVAGADGAEIKGLEVRLGKSQASGDINLKLGKTLSIAARLGAGRIDLDQWLGEADIPAPSSSTASSPGKSSATGSTGPGPSVNKAVAAKPKGPPAFFIPKFVHASLALTAEAMTYRGGVVRNGVLNAELTNGEITVSQVSAQFPGGSDLALFGFVTVAKGKPRFEGELESTVNDLRGVLRWLGRDIDGVAKDRLRKMALATRVVAVPGQIQLSGLNLQFDSSKLTGGVTVALRRRLSFGANIAINRLNLDAYLPKQTKKASSRKAASKGGKTASGATAKTAGKKQDAKADGPLAPIKVLGELDANLTVRVKSLTYNGASIKNAVFDGTLYNGKLKIRRLSADRLAGAKVSAKGVFDNLTGVPKVAGLTFKAETGNISGVLRFAGLDAMPSLKGLGAVSVNGRVDGSLLAPKLKINLVGAGATATVYGQLDGLALVPAVKKLTLQIKAKDTTKLLKLAGIKAVTARQLGAITVAGVIDGNLVTPLVTLDIKAAGGSAAVSGRINTLPISDTLDMSVQVRHPNLSRLMRTLAGYRPAGKVGKLDIQARLRGGSKGVTLTGLVAKAGNIELRGDVVVGLGGPNPDIKAKLTGGPIVIDPFLPAQKTASLWPGLKIIPVATRRRGARWSTDPIDLSGLGGINARVTLKTPSLQYRGYNLQNADLSVSLGNERLIVDKLTGVLFGGALRATAATTTTARPRMKTVIALENMNVGEATRALTGTSMAGGKMAFQANLATAGGSVAGLISGLNGNGSLRLKDIDTQKGKDGTMLAGALGLVSALTQVTGLFSGGSKSGSLVDISGTFAIRGGIASSRDMRIASGLGDGAAAGAIDLPRWRIDVKGNIKLGQNILRALISKGTRRNVTQTVPFAVYGNLDSPNVKLDTSKITGGGLPIPGADRLLKKLPKGVGGILHGILGGGQQQSAPPSSGDTSPPPPQQQQQQQVNPVDLLKGLFKRR